MDPWADLASFLEALASELRGEAFAFYDARFQQLLPFTENVHLIEDFQRARAALEATFGAGFLGRGTGKRHVHEEPGHSFVAEPVLGAYLVLIVIRRPMLESSLVTGLLEATHPQLCEIIRRLPPIDGGPAAVAQRRG